MYFGRNDLNNFGPNNIDVPKKEIMMCLNESPFNPFEYFHEAIHNKIKDLNINRYFNEYTEKLLEQLARYTSLDKENILIGNGADELLYFIFVASRSSDTSCIVAPAPSYFDYFTYSRAVGLKCHLVDLMNDFSLDTDSYIEALKSIDSVGGIICNPNNPTGNLIDDNDILKVLESTNKIVILDEAYYEFSDKTYVSLIKKYKNLLILRSFSKGFFSAGLRFGYILGSKEVIYELSKVLTAFNMSRLTEIVALTYLENLPWFTQNIETLKANRTFLTNSLNSFDNITAFESNTNFVTFQIPNCKDELFEFIKAQDIAIRDVSGHRLLKDCLRVTVGNIIECELFIKAVTEFFRQII